MHQNKKMVCGQYIFKICAILGYISNYFKDTCIQIEPDTIRNQTKPNIILKSVVFVFPAII